MKNMISAILIVCCYGAMACDICGASGSSNSIGLLPQYYNHFAGIQYQYRGYSSTHPAGHEVSGVSASEEHFQNAILWAGVKVQKSIQVFAYVPYQYNMQYNNGNKGIYSGLGDISTIAMVTLVKPVEGNSKPFRHTLMAGGGVKAPTGKCGMVNIDSMMNMLPGTGSWDFSVNANYILGYKNAGMQTEASYTITTANAQQYKFGNKLSVNTQLFYRYKPQAVVWVPQAGVRLDYRLHDYTNYNRKWLDEQTGGYMLYATAGMQLFYRKLGLQCSYSIPVSQKYATGYVRMKQQVDAGLLIIF